MIAIHTAVSIFKPTALAGEGGLYSYRYVAYAIWAVFPILMASLAFINGSHEGYTSGETFCYLPIRPFWYLMALAWVPRYIIFIVILGVYVSIYVYVRYKFYGFMKIENLSIPSTQSMKDRVSRLSRRPRSVYVERPLDRHGLISDSGENTIVGRDSTSTVESAPAPSPVVLSMNLDPQDDAGPSVAIVAPPLIRHGVIPDFPNNIMIGKEYSSAMENIQRPPSELSPTVCTHKFIWSNLVSPQVKSAPQTSSLHTEIHLKVLGLSSLSDPPTPLPRFPSPTAIPHTARHSTATTSPVEARVASGSINQPFLKRLTMSPDSSTNAKRSIVDLRTALIHGPEFSKTTTSITTLELVNSHGQNLVDAEIMRTREKISRQLRFLFIYPLAYIIMWILPFATHVLQYEDKYAHQQPFALTCAATFMISSQATVDSLLFCTRERPWRHITGPGGKSTSFWRSLGFWTGWRSVFGRKERYAGPGRTRDERLRDAEEAYQRRDEEMAIRRSELLERRAGERNWWAETGIDGAGVLSPLPEEWVFLEETSETEISDEEGVAAEEVTTTTLSEKGGEDEIESTPTPPVPPATYPLGKPQ